MHDTESLKRLILMVLHHRRRHLIVLMEYAAALGKPTERLSAEFERLRWLHRLFTEDKLPHVVRALGAPTGSPEVAP